MMEGKWRTISLLACLGALIGSVGPWETTFIGDVAGTKGDGKVSLVLILIAALLIFVVRPDSPRRGLLTLAAIAGVACALLGVADIIKIGNSTQKLFGREVDLVDPGWGIWLMTISAGVLAVAAIKYRQAVAASEVKPQEATVTQLRPPSPPGPPAAPED